MKNHILIYYSTPSKNGFVRGGTYEIKLDITKIKDIFCSPFHGNWNISDHYEYINLPDKYKNILNSTNGLKIDVYYHGDFIHTETEDISIFSFDIIKTQREAKIKDILSNKIFCHGGSIEST